MVRLSSFCLVAVCLLASGCRSAPPPAPDSGPIGELIRLLESDTLRRDEDVQLRGFAKDRLNGLIRDGGENLVLQALGRLDHPDPGMRRRAQLTLALTENVAASVWEDLTRSPRNDVRALALLRLERDRSEIGEFDVCGPFGDFGPLKEVAGELRELLVPNAETIAGWSEEFAADYRADMAPRFPRFWEHVTPTEQRLADLDGDGIPEVVVAAELWKGASYRHRWTFIAVLQRVRPDVPHRVVFFKLLDDESLSGLAVADFDGDGILECAVRHYWLAVNNGCTTLTMLSGRHFPEAPRIESWKPAYCLSLLRSRDGETAEFVGTSIYKLANTCTVTERIGALAVEACVYRWSRAGFLESARVYVPLN